ncbi:MULTISPECIES: hypothetical protein [Exiguobacterium]|uniref:hypothetical protein n=1 Tax=Exiguobacterium TaxID=33986 RepID=UPI001BE927E4|nr:MULTISPECIES: hypothetical protein [Exiguobacterium]MCT4792853.1 hypothetical protein [Exiguobacterium artemiae]
MTKSPIFIGEPVHDRILDGVPPAQIDWRDLPLGKGGGIPTDKKKDRLIAVKAKVLLQFPEFSFTVEIVIAYEEFLGHELTAEEIYRDLAYEAFEAFGDQMLGAIVMTTGGAEINDDMKYDEVAQTIALKKITVSFDEVTHARYRFL